MRLLVLGGSVFLSRAVAQVALNRGHEVTCACRGSSGAVPEGAQHVVLDRTGPIPDELSTGSFDAVVDVARQPSFVRTAVESFPHPHWVFVSTINVYQDEETPGGTPSTLTLRAPIADDVDLDQDPEAYGPMKAACEQIVLDGAASSMVIRPGLIVGPDDPTGRFTYWPRRLAQGGEVLAPGDPADLVQVIDVRDLASWIVDSAESRTIGIFDGVGSAIPIAALLASAINGVGSSSDESVRPLDTKLTWVDQAFLETHQVAPWSGDRSIPLWLPRPAYDGMLAHDATPSYDAGLVTRPIADTTRDTLAWLLENPDSTVTGLTRDDERAVLDAWHAAG